VTPWAYVFVDGSSRGPRREGTDTLAPGPHRLRFERDGFVPLDTVVTLQAGKELLLKFRLTPRAP